MKRFQPHRLAEALKGRDLSRVAEDVGVTERTLRNWLLGRGEPRATDLAVIASVTGKSIGYFFQEGAA